jgi:hypothetical protein
MKISSKKLIIIGTLLALLAMVPTSVFAKTGTKDGYTFTVPDDYESWMCDPSDKVSVSGVPDGWWVQFRFGDANTGEFLGIQWVQSTGGSISVKFPYEGRTGYFFTTFLIHEFRDGQWSTSYTQKWHVTCIPADGCSPGYWKKHLDDWPPTGYSPGDDFDDTFDVGYFDPDITLDDAVNLGGGGVKKVARHGTAALLNAAHPVLDYPFTVAEVIAFVKDQDVDILAKANELGCEIK